MRTPGAIILAGCLAVLAGGCGSSRLERPVPWPAGGAEDGSETCVEGVVADRYRAAEDDPVVIVVLRTIDEALRPVRVPVRWPDGARIPEQGECWRAAGEVEDGGIDAVRAIKVLTGRGAVESGSSPR